MEPLIVVYDKECPFCRGRVEWLRRRDRLRALHFEAAQAPGLVQRHPQFGGLDLLAGMHVLMPTGQVHGGADAVYAVARVLPGWRHVALLYRIPVLRPLFRALYQRVARRRKRDGPTCACDAGPPR